MKKPYIKAQIKTIETQTIQMLAGSDQTFGLKASGGGNKADVKQKMWDDDEDVEW